MDLMLIQLLIDDQELAEYLNATYGMVTHYADIREERQELPSGSVVTMVWSVGGGPESSVSIADDGVHSQFSMLQHIWWPRGEALGRLDMDTATQKPILVTSRVAHGEIRAPMAMAEVVDGNFNGQATWAPEFTSANTFGLYSDHNCSPP